MIDLVNLIIFNDNQELKIEFLCFLIYYNNNIENGIQNRNFLTAFEFESLVMVTDATKIITSKENPQFCFCLQNLIWVKAYNIQCFHIYHSMVTVSESKIDEG